MIFSDTVRTKHVSQSSSGSCGSMRQAADLPCVAAAGLAGGRGPLATALLSVAPGGGGVGGGSLATALLLSVGGAGGGGGGGSLATALLSVGRGSLATALLLLAAAGLGDRTGRGGPTRASSGRGGGP